MCIIHTCRHITYMYIYYIQANVMLYRDIIMPLAYIQLVIGITWCGIYTYIHTYIYTYMYVWLCIFTDVHKYVYLQIYNNSLIRIYSQINLSY